MRAVLSMLVLVAVAVGMPLALAGCEESHTESTKSNLLGGQTHQETTVTRNPVTGNTSVDSEKQVTH